MKPAILPFFWILLVVPAWPQGGPPLRTDDPGTPGDGTWEVNFAFEMEDSTAERVYATALDVNYGLGERLQLKVEVPWVFLDNGRRRDGLGRPQVGVKWRFFDARGMALSVYPQFEVEGRGSSADRGLVDSGTELLLPLQATRSWGSVDLNAELGYAWRSGGDEWLAGLAVRHERPRGIQLLAEIHGSGAASGGGDEWIANLGLRQPLGARLTLLASVGRGIAGDEESDTIAFLGLQTLFSPRRMEP